MMPQAEYRAPEEMKDQLAQKVVRSQNAYSAMLMVAWSAMSYDTGAEVQKLRPSERCPDPQQLFDRVLDQFMQRHPAKLRKDQQGTVGNEGVGRRRSQGAAYKGEAGYK